MFPDRTGPAGAGRIGGDILRRPSRMPCGGRADGAAAARPDLHRGGDGAGRSRHVTIQFIKGVAT